MISPYGNEGISTEFRISWAPTESVLDDVIKKRDDLDILYDPGANILYRLSDDGKIRWIEAESADNTIKITIFKPDIIEGEISYYYSSSRGWNTR